MPCMSGREYPWKLEHWWTKLAVIGLAWTSRHSSRTGSSERMNQEIRRWEDRKFWDWEVLHKLCLVSSKLKYSSLCTRKASVPGKKTLTHFMSHHRLRPDLAKSAPAKGHRTEFSLSFHQGLWESLGSVWFSTQGYVTFLWVFDNMRLNKP